MQANTFARPPDMAAEAPRRGPMLGGVELLVEFAEVAEACGRHADMLEAAIAAAMLSCGAPIPESCGKHAWERFAGSGAVLSPLSEGSVPSSRCLAVLARGTKFAVSETRAPLRMLDVLDEHEPRADLKPIAAEYRATLATQAASARKAVHDCLARTVLPALEAAADRAAADAQDGAAPAGRGPDPAAGASGAAGGPAVGDLTRGIVLVCRLLGDLERYAAEAEGGTGQRGPAAARASAASAAALSRYSKSMQVGASALPAWSPVRLATALNLSVFLFERHGDEAEAARVAREAAEAAEDSAPTAAEIEAEGGEEARAEGARLLRLLQENLAAWRRVLRVERLMV